MLNNPSRKKIGALKFELRKWKRSLIYKDGKLTNVFWNKMAQEEIARVEKAIEDLEFTRTLLGKN